MKKIILTAAFTLLSTAKLLACGDYYDQYYYYSLIFSQELINSPRYYPFLLSPSVAYYEADSAKVQNANIKEWQEYLRIPYDEAYYLVFKASKDDVQKLVAGKSVSDKQLKFANATFTKKYKDALQYLLTAKELEPYMAISGHNSGWGYYDEVKNDIDELPYDQISMELQKGWKQAKDKEIKLRYGYQLVRFAHYNRNYEEAIKLFDIYVEPLKHKSEMYYYALSQKAGAIRGTGDVIEANRLFFDVFSYSADLKTIALSSIKLNENVDYSHFQEIAKTTDEQNDADLLLGYISFSNPLVSARKIIQRSPDAIQAKVLTARALSMIEEDIERYPNVSEYDDKRFPILNKRERRNFEEVRDFVYQQAKSDAVKQKNYWNIASAYLAYLDKNYTLGQTYLEKVDIKEEGYAEQRDILAMLIDLGSEERITSEVEERIFAQYNDVFTKTHVEAGRTKAAQFALDLLSNRYYLQGDYGKSFMLLNVLTALHDNPNLDILYSILGLYNKENKNTFEQYLTSTFRIGLYDQNKEAGVTVLEYIDYMLGIIYLTNGTPERALGVFESSGYSDEHISSDVFGYNRIECFTCEDNMHTDYLSDFPYIQDSMSELELTNTLFLLGEEADGDGLKAAKANYLLGNFYYNTSVTGYFRNYLRFGYEGVYRQQFFRWADRNNILNELIYLKEIPTYYDNTARIANGYLEKAYTLATGDEFKTRIVFALSKCEQAAHYQDVTDTEERSSWWARSSKGWVMISDRQYFKEMMKYKNTNFFKEVESNCKYFEYYVSHL